MVTRLSVAIPQSPRHEHRSATGKTATFDRVRLCYVPLGTAPEDAVSLCKDHGLTVDVDDVSSVEIPSAGFPGES